MCLLMGKSPKYTNKIDEVNNMSTLSFHCLHLYNWKYCYLMRWKKIYHLSWVLFCNFLSQYQSEFQYQQQSNNYVISYFKTNLFFHKILVFHSAKEVNVNFNYNDWKLMLYLNCNFSDESKKTANWPDIWCHLSWQILFLTYLSSSSRHGHKAATNIIGLRNISEYVLAKHLFVTMDQLQF